MAIASIAVPVFGPGREVAAALGTSAPLVRFGEARRAELRDALRETAREIARAWFGGVER